MRRLSLLATSILLAGAVATSAHAAAKFTDVGAQATNGNLPRSGGPDVPTIHGGLYVTFTEVGLGSAASTDYRVTADATAVYLCINNAGNQPKAENKNPVAGPIAVTGTFTANKNGKIEGAIAVAPLGPGDFGCPTGHTLFLQSVRYTNVVITDLTNGVSASIPGTFSLSFP